MQNARLLRLHTKDAAYLFCLNKTLFPLQCVLEILPGSYVLSLSFQQLTSVLYRRWTLFDLTQIPIDVPRHHYSA